jgi:hypothetical protein
MTMDAASRPDPSRCPVCGESNRCALEVERETGQAQPPCWCMQVDFSDALLARVPAGQRRLACICARCAAQDALQA